MGGLAMFGAFVLAVGMALPAEPGTYALLFASLLLVAIGVIDDRWGLSANVRFLAQIIATLVMCYGGGMAVHSLGDLFFVGEITLGSGAIAFTVIGAVGAINAMNMADGLDGLAGGLALVTITALLAIAWRAGLDGEFYLLLALAFVLIGFLHFNARTPWRSRARVFMGDAGSMFLGLLLAWLLVRLSQGPEPAMVPVTALWVFALPLLDTVSVMLRRLLNGRSPFAADRQHLHHLLLLAGFSVPQAVLIMVGLAALLAAIGAAGNHAGVPEGVMFIGFAALFALYCWAMNRAWSVIKAIEWLSRATMQQRDMVSSLAKE